MVMMSNWPPLVAMSVVTRWRSTFSSSTTQLSLCRCACSHSGDSFCMMIMSALLTVAMVNCVWASAHHHEGSTTVAGIIRSVRMSILSRRCPHDGPAAFPCGHPSRLTVNALMPATKRGGVRPCRAWSPSARRETGTRGPCIDPGPLRSGRRARTRALAPHPRRLGRPATPGQAARWGTLPGACTGYATWAHRTCRRRAGSAGRSSSGPRTDPPPRVFLLSPATVGGQRMACSARVRRSSSRGGAVRGRAAGGRLPLRQRALLPRQARLRAGVRAAARRTSCGLVIVTRRRASRRPVRADDLRAFAAVPVDAGDPRYREPLGARRRAGAASRPAGEAVLLGSVASAKYVDVLLACWASGSASRPSSSGAAT